MHIGLIGGIGPAATTHYYRLLLERIDDIELTISHARLKTLGPNVAAGNTHAQAAIFARHVEKLKGAGAEVAVVTSIAGHFCIEALIELSVLPIVNALDSLKAHFDKHRFERIGVLGNQKAMKSQLFGMIDTVELVAPREDLITPVSNAYTRMAQRGSCNSDERSLFLEAGNDMISRGNADAVLLGGTDLYLAFHGQDVHYPLIDAALVHTEDIVRIAQGDA